MSVWFFVFFLGVGGFQKSYVIFGGGMSKYLLFLTGVGGWSEKGPKHNIKMVPYYRWKRPQFWLSLIIKGDSCLNLIAVDSNWNEWLF